jgi:hypothetical protein
LAATAARVQAGSAPGAALAEQFPEFAAIFEDGPTLPDRIERVGAMCLRRHGLARRVSVASAYPMALATGLLVVCGALWWAEYVSHQAFEGRAGMNGQHQLFGVAVAVFVLTLWGWLRRRPPIWLRVLPGGRVWALSAAADYLAVYALQRDPFGADHAPEAARVGAGEMPDNTLVGPILAVAESAPNPLQALNDAVERLDVAAAAETRRLALTLSTGMLLMVALGLAGLAWGELYHPLIYMSGAGL